MLNVQKMDICNYEKGRLKMILQFGKHKGKSITEVPASYLDYLLGWDKLKPEMRTAIEAVKAGTYHDPVRWESAPVRPAYEPPDYHDRIMKATRTGARRAIADVGQAVEGLDMSGEYKSMVLNMLLEVAKSTSLS
jgi:hypothetical protein